MLSNRSSATYRYAACRYSASYTAMLSAQVQPCADSRATDRLTDRQSIYCEFTDGLNEKDDWLLLNVSEVNAASAAWLLSVSVSVS